MFKRKPLINFALIAAAVVVVVSCKLNSTDGTTSGSVTNFVAPAAGPSTAATGGGGGGGGGGGSSYDPNATTIGYGVVAHFNNSRTYDLLVSRLSATKLVIVTRDMATGGLLKGFIADVAGSTVTMGAKQSIDDNCSGCRMASLAALSSTRFVVAYPDSNDSSKGVARTCDVAGTVISCNAKALYTANGVSAGQTSVSALSATTFAVTYFDSGTSGKANVGTVAGDGTITYGATTTFENGMSMVYEASAPLSATQFVVAYEDGTDMKGKALVGTVNGTNLTFSSSEFVFNNAATSLGLTVTALSSSKFVVAYVKQNNNGGAKIGDVSGSGVGALINYGNEAFYTDNSDQYLSLSTLASDKLVISFINNDLMSYGGKGGVATIGTVSGNSISWGWGYQFQDYNFASPGFAAAAAFSDSGFLTIASSSEINQGVAYVGTVTP